MTSYQQYDEFQRRRGILVSFIKGLRGLLASLDMADTAKSLQQLVDLVQSDAFKVLVLGEFKRGKSTFINAILGDEILPAYAKPCTAIINEVKWGEARRALLHYAQPVDAQPISPQEVAVEELEKYIVIQDDVRESQENRFDKVELFWPLPLCENGVEIIDSPGLNEHDIRQKITMDYLSRVDAILFVLSCEALASKSELDVIDNILKPTGHEDIFFICNRFNMIREKEKADVKEYGISRLAPRTRGPERVFFISALDALEGRVENDEERVKNSGIIQVEQELERFLATERGRIKILRPARELQAAISSARRTIPLRKSMLTTDIMILEERFEDAQEPLRHLEAERDQIIRRIANFNEDLKLTISSNACSFFRSLPSQCSGWVETLEAKNLIKFLSFELTQAQAEKLIAEIVSFLSEKVQSEFLAWQTQTLQPLVEDRLSGMLEELDERASVFVDKIDAVRIQISGADVSIDDVAPRKVGAIERVLSAAGGFFIGGIGSAGLGAAFGYQEMAKSILPQAGLAIVTIMLVGLNPLFLIPIMVSGGLVQGIWSMKATNDKIKDEVSKRFAASIRDSAQQRGNEVAEAVVAELVKIQNGVDEGLRQEIRSVVNQVESIKTEKQKGQENVNQKLEELSSLERELGIIDDELDKLVMEVALPSD